MCDHKWNKNKTYSSFSRKYEAGKVGILYNF